MTGTALIAKWPELRKLSPKQVIAGAQRCVGEEHEATLRLLLYLTEVERRHAFEDVGKRSLWPFIQETLGYAEYETRLRFHAARLLLRFPIVAEYLADRRLTMTTLVLLKDELTDANVRDWCEKAANKSKAKIEEEIASTKRPVVDFAMWSTVNPTIQEVAPSAAPSPDGPVPDSAPSSPPPQAASYVVKNAPSKASVKPMTVSQRRLDATVSLEWAADLDEVADLLSEVFPDKDPVKVLGYCLKEVKKRLLKKRVDPSKLSTTEPTKPQSPSATAATTPGADKTYRVHRVTVTKRDLDLAIAGRNRDGFKRVAIPIDTAREVWERDNYCCQRVLKNGERCLSTYQCQLDHLRAVADGGSNEPSNLRVHCRMHNLQRARERFGNERIARAIAQRRGPSPRKPASATRGERPPSLFQ